MRPFVALLPLVVACVCAGQAQIQALSSATPVTAAAEKPFVSPQTLAQLEYGFEDRVKAIKGEEPFSLLGASSCFYLEGYGVVLTIPLDLIVTPSISPFHQVLTQQEREQVRRRKTAQLPVLKQAARDMVASVAASLTSLPMDRKISVAVRIYYQAWEDSSGLPRQIVATADRRSAQAGAIQLEEQ